MWNRAMQTLGLSLFRHRSAHILATKCSHTLLFHFIMRSMNFTVIIFNWTWSNATFCYLLTTVRKSNIWFIPFGGFLVVVIMFNILNVKLLVLIILHRFQIFQILGAICIGLKNHLHVSYLLQTFFSLRWNLSVCVNTWSF